VPDQAKTEQGITSGFTRLVPGFLGNQKLSLNTPST